MIRVLYCSQRSQQSLFGHRLHSQTNAYIESKNVSRVRRHC
jgi:hypothetical protein